MVVSAVVETFALLEAQGATALSDYVSDKGYLDFGSNDKTLGKGMGFWVNR